MAEIVRVNGIHRVKAKGRTYLYHRASKTRLKCEPGTAAFAAEVDALDAAIGKNTDAKPGSLGALIDAYRLAPEFTELKPRTRKDYDAVFAYLRDHAADMPLIEIDGAFVLELRDRTFRARKRRFANYVVQVLRLTLTWGKPRKFVEHNAAMDTPLVKRPKNARKVNRAWTDAEQVAVMAAAPAHLRRIIVLGMYAAVREGDAVAMPWSAYDGRALEWNQGKTGAKVWVPAHRDLKATLDTTPRKSPVMCLTTKGRPWTESGFRASFFKLLRALVRSGKVEKGLTFHGLRHSAGKYLADAGAPKEMIAALLGQKSLASAALYSEEADQKKRTTAAIRKLEHRRK